MKLGLIGLGNIAHKAYLPILTTNPEIDLHLFTRNPDTLTQVGKQYRITNLHASLADLVGSGIQAAFVNASTKSHYDIVSFLLENGVHVFVDKPMSDQPNEFKSMVEMAETKNLSLMVGFNRRYAPAYTRIHGIAPPQLITMQKNRAQGSNPFRFVIYDDFIHVVDILRYFLDAPIQDLNVHGKIEDNKLVYLTLHMNTRESTAIGIMHRYAGVNEEILETITVDSKYRVEEVRSITEYRGRVEQILPDSWSTTYQDRGFKNMVNYFLESVRNGVIISARDALKSHLLCEEIINRMEHEEITLN